MSYRLTLNGWKMATANKREVLMKLFKLISLPMHDGDAGAGGGAADEAARLAAEAAAKAGKTFTQDELDAVVKSRLAREQKAWETKLAEERKPAEMTEQDKLKAAAAEAENKGKEAVSAANQRLIKAEAKVQASELGVKSDRIAYLLKLADLSGVTINDNGDVDEAAVKKAVETVLKDLPELKGTGGSGFNIPGGGSATGQINPWKKETFNLTKQGEIMKSNPELAKQLKAAAGK